MRTGSWTKQAWQERMDAKLAAAHGTLAAQVAALQSGEDWKRFLDLQASLHSYSPNNEMLITAQHAKALRRQRRRRRPRLCRRVHDVESARADG